MGSDSLAHVISMLGSSGHVKVTPGFWEAAVGGHDQDMDPQEAVDAINEELDTDYELVVDDDGE